MGKCQFLPSARMKSARCLSSSRELESYACWHHSEKRDNHEKWRFCRKRWGTIRGQCHRMFLFCLGRTVGDACKVSSALRTSSADVPVSMPLRPNSHRITSSRFASSVLVDGVSGACVASGHASKGLFLLPRGCLHV